MKIKGTLIILGLIVTIISGVKFNSFKKTKNELETVNIVSSEENVVKEENIVDEDKEHIEQDSNTIEPTEQIINVEQEKVTEPIKETAKSATTQATPNTETKKETVTRNTQETTQKQEKSESVVETPKKEETQANKTLTPSDLEYWCVAGGSHHVAGDGNNEHGYYKTWDEAYQAFEDYTKGWASVQYKISQCSCGLYYFWAIQ